MTRERPYTQVVVSLAAPLQPGATYTVTANGFPGLLGRVRSSSRAFTITAREPAPPATPP